MNYERVSFLNLRNPVILFDVISSLEEGRAASFGCDTPWRSLH